MKQFFFLVILSFSCFVQAQKGTISGVLTDKDMNNEPLPFANVQIKGTTIGTTTDENGKYNLQVEPGNYVVVFSFLGYQTVENPVTVKANQMVTINKSMTSGDGVMLADVVVATTRRKNTEAALVMEMKEAKQVVSAISAEQMSKGTDGNAAQAIQRVPGITVVDGKYVIVRGLSERYNNVLINQSIAPSTEVNKRTFSFDLVPTNALDKMVIYKTGSADKPGDFAGGIIALTTSENNTEFTRVDVGFGYRTNTTFKKQFHSEKSDTDFLGFDNNYRNLPSSFPSTYVLQDSPRTSAIRLDAAQSLPNNFSPSSQDVFLNSSVGFSFGRKINAGKIKIFTTNGFNYSTSYKTYNRGFSEVTGYNLNGEKLPLKSDYNDAVNQEDVRISVLSNWIFTFNENHKIKFKNLFNQIGENDSNLREGFNFLQRNEDKFKNYMFGYKSRSIYIGQLNGDHKLNDTNLLDWVVGYNYLQENEPDLRRFRTVQPADDTTAPFSMIAPPSSNLFDTSRFYGNLKEFSANQGLNYTVIFNRQTEEEELAPAKLKLGYLVDYRYRLFKSRYISYLLPGYVPQDRQDELINLPLDEIFNPLNISQNNGWVIEEGTKPSDSYKADNFLTAGYAMFELPVHKFDITAGVRVENNQQRLRYFDNRYDYFKNNNSIFSFLPSLNVGYNITEKSLLRVAYSRTVNRPEFRELSENLFYDFKLNANILGNPSLTTATIDNFDLRYEFYPTKGETISLGAFYKNFDKPIENKIFTAEQRTFSLINADKAFNYGVELEIKKSFKDFFNNIYLDRLSTNINFAYVVSEVDLGAGDFAQDKTRALQGQSPYVLNFALGYEDEKGLSVNAIFNKFGTRIYAVGDLNFPTILEQSRDQLDLAIAKKFKTITVKWSAQNLLNAAFNLYDDTDKNYKIDSSKDIKTSSYREGILFNLNLTYNF
ncbi:TonB-dependent receptor domain-containing protein [Flavobacterium sp.]|uniref:TonB-dependent receptor n=1 Tax=Flavobacterium sp. TaxID=239 RepID=UPI0039E2C4D1